MTVSSVVLSVEVILAVVEALGLRQSRFKLRRLKDSRQQFIGDVLFQFGLLCKNLLLQAFQNQLDVVARLFLSHTLSF